MQLHLPILALNSWATGVLVRKWLPIASSAFQYQFQRFGSDIEIFHPFWIDFCTGWEVRVWLGLLRVDIQFSQQHFLGNILFSNTYFLLFCQRSDGCNCVFISESFILFHCLHICFCYHGLGLCFLKTAVRQDCTLLDCGVWMKPQPLQHKVGSSGDGSVHCALPVPKSGVASAFWHGIFSLWWVYQNFTPL
jgi:hypothetical protein